MADVDSMLPRHPGVSNYEDAQFVFADFGPGDLTKAIVGVIPGEDGVARYLYDYSLLRALWEDFYRALKEDEQKPLKLVKPADVEADEEITDRAHEAVMSIDWKDETEGGWPLLVTDPDVEPLWLELESEEPESITVGNRTFWVVP